MFLINLFGKKVGAQDPASRSQLDKIVTTTVHNPTGGRMFLINLFGKKVGAQDPASRSQLDRIVALWHLP